jgi:4-hydroxy 2-oxovalerate aldolase
MKWSRLMSVKILDCTLRDGAHLNNGEFGMRTANDIVNNLVASGIEFIEVGFLEPGNSTNTNTYFSSMTECEKYFDKVAKEDAKLGLMLRTDRCPLETIEKNNFIDFIRIAFYPEHLKEVLVYSEKVKKLNYKLGLNLIATPGYSNAEISAIIKQIRSIGADIISIVDTHGELRSGNLDGIINLFLPHIPLGSALGLHLHENLNCSSELVLKFLTLIPEREKIIDVSLNGMGRAPGNAATELIVSLLETLNIKKYNTQNLFKLSTKVANLKTNENWGYSGVYAYSAIMKLDRTYGEYLLKHASNHEDAIDILTLLKLNGAPKKFNKQSADKLLKEFKIDQKF